LAALNSYHQDANLEILIRNLILPGVKMSLCLKCTLINIKKDVTYFDFYSLGDRQGCIAINKDYN